MKYFKSFTENSMRINSFRNFFRHQDLRRFRRKTNILGLALFCLAFLLSAHSFAAGTSSRELFSKALNAAADGKVSAAIDGLQKLLEMKQSDVSTDLLLLTAGRLAYQQKKYNLAEKYLTKIPTTSDYWIEAKEERAWSNYMKKDLNGALSDLKPLLDPRMRSRIGPEPFFLQALVDLRTCHFRGVVATMKDYKEIWSSKAESLQSLERGEWSENMSQALRRYMDEGGGSENLDKEEGFFPRMMDKDVELQKAIKILDYDAAKKRVSEMADQDLRELAEVMKKMKVVEIEYIQRLPTVKADKNNPGTFKKSDSRSVTYPVSDEIWADELEGMEVRSTGCISLDKKQKGRKL